MNSLIRQDIHNIIESLEKELSLLEGKTILISGGAGFIGSYLVAVLLTLNEERFQKPCKIIVMDNFITGSRKNALIDAESNPHFQLIEHDVSKPLPDVNADYIIHAAGLASPFHYRKSPLETVDVFVGGTRNFLELARQKKVRGLLYFSSSEVYGDPHPDFIPTPETYWGNVSASGPRACYDESKRLGETLCSIYHQLYNLPVKIARPFNVYGPGMRMDDYRVIPTFLTRGLNNQPIQIYNHGNQTRTFCYITDAVQGFLKILLRGKAGEAYNVGSDNEEIGIASLAKITSKIFPKPIGVELINYPESYPAGEPQRRCPDLSKIKKELGFSPKIELEMGLAKTLKWYQDRIKDE